MRCNLLNDNNMINYQCSTKFELYQSNFRWAANQTFAKPILWQYLFYESLITYLSCLCYFGNTFANSHPSPYRSKHMKADMALPTGHDQRRKLQPGFSWWLMPHNQSIGQWGSEIRSWTRWPEEACDPAIIHLCPHRVPLNVCRSVPALNSPPLTKRADAIRVSAQLGLLGHNTTPTSRSLPLSAQLGDPGPLQKT